MLPVSTHHQATRDLRVDLLRGLALLMIFVNHQEVFTGCIWLRDYTLVSLCFCDGFELFIFLSGFACAQAYGRTLTRHGYAACQKKAFQRASYLYLVNFVLYAAVTSLAYAFPLISSNAQAATFLGHAVEHPVSASIQFAVMRYHPVALNVLHLYVLLLIGTPFMRWMIERRRRLSLLLSATIYALAQVADWLEHPSTFLGMNIYAWQFIYFLGMAAGAARRPLLLNQPAVKTFATASAIALVAWVLVARKIAPLAMESGVSLESIWSMFPGEAFAVQSKANLHPLRVANFLALALLAARWLPSSERLASFAIAKPIVVCGQHSLLVFCTGVFLNYLGALVIIPSFFSPPLRLTTLLYEALGTLVLLAIGWWAHLQKEDARRK